MGNTAPAGEPPFKQYTWNIASRRGIDRAEFEARWEQAAADPDQRDDFWLFVVGTEPHEDRIYDPDVEGDIPEHLLDYGAPGCFLDEHMSVEGCRWRD